MTTKWLQKGHSGRCCLWKGTHKGSKKDAAAVSTPLPVSKQTHFQKKTKSSDSLSHQNGMCTQISRNCLPLTEHFQSMSILFPVNSPKMEWAIGKWPMSTLVLLMFVVFCLASPNFPIYVHYTYVYTYVINYTHSANCARSIPTVADYSRSDFKLRTRIWSQPSGGTWSKSAQSWVENLLSHSAGRAIPILQLTLQKQLECQYTTVSSSSWCYWG